MAETFELLIKNGLQDFYEGTILKKIFSDLKKTDCILMQSDFNDFNSSIVKPLKIKLDNCSVFNLPPPTQGIASLMLLGILNQIKDKNDLEYKFIHNIVVNYLSSSN